jgi:alginate O-acetyltransferase complex protein AlgI
MVFSSIVFLLFFLPIFFGFYYFAGRKYKNLVFLLFSILFYAWGAPDFVYVLIGSTGANFFLVRWMYNASGKSERRGLAAVSVVLNLGLLAYFKYSNFFVENLNAVLSELNIDPFNWTRVVLPIGISFFTFQSLTYTIDVYRRIHKPLKNPLDYVLYIMMFPQLIAGPIVRYETIADQLTRRTETNSDRLTGFYRFVIGLAKKVLVADILAQEVNIAMGGDISQLGSSAAWIGILAYTFQIYFDFAGYSDMAIGIGRMLGFRFPENFDNPYTAASVTEFWRRWHMTFTTFMRLYLYYPLGGNRVKTSRRLYFNLFFVFIISGLWHGAAWNFILWGVLHGLLLVLERVFLLKWLKRAGKAVGVVYTFLIVALVWVPFRAETLPDALNYFNRLFAFDFEPLHFAERNYIYATLLLAWLFSMITFSKIGKKAQDWLYNEDFSDKGHIFRFVLALVFFMICIASLAGWGFSPFIYFRF